MEKTCELLRAVGIKDTSAFEENGVTGGDLLELTQDDMAEALSLSPLQASSVPSCFLLADMAVAKAKGNNKDV